MLNFAKVRWRLEDATQATMTSVHLIHSEIHEHQYRTDGHWSPSKQTQEAASGDSSFN